MIFGAPPRQRQSFSNRAALVAVVFDGVLNVAVSEVILNEPRIRALVGEGEAAGVAQHVGMGEQGQDSGGGVFRSARLTVERCNSFRCSLTKNVLPIGFIRARCFSQAATATARSPLPRSGCVVDSPPFNRATCSTRLSVSTWSSFNRQASDTRKPSRNIKSKRQRSRTSFRRPVVASMRRSTSRSVRCLRSVSSRRVPVSAPVHHFVES
jgi:hypothetical protein